jgi:hypothetical protein
LAKRDNTSPAFAHCRAQCASTASSPTWHSLPAPTPSCPLPRAAWAITRESPPSSRGRRDARQAHDQRRARRAKRAAPQYSYQCFPRRQSILALNDRADHRTETCVVPSPPAAASFRGTFASTTRSPVPSSALSPRMRSAQASCLSKRSRTRSSPILARCWRHGPMS